MTKIPKQPSQLLQDNEGHWYLIPGSYLPAFENGLALTGPLYEAHVSKFSRYGVDGPHKIVILNWREL